MTLAAAVVIVKIPKRVDYAIAPHLVEDLDKKICDGNSVVLDFSQTRSIIPAMTDIFLTAVITAKQRNARLSLQGVKPNLKVMLELGGVLDHFRRR